MDIRTQVTNTIISLIESGNVTDWKKPWKSMMAQGLPVNYATKRPYSGINVLLLWDAAARNEYTRNEWLTFKQAQSLGANVRKGAKGVMGVFFSMVPRKDASPEDATSGESMVPMLKAFWVFNVDDVENLPAVETTVPAFQPIEAAECILANCGISIHHGGDHAKYSRKYDRITLPVPEAFFSAEDYYSTAIHELVHGTGHDKRLNREFGKRFGDNAYAFEELVAELGSAFIMAHLGLDGNQIDNHASYVANWLQILRDDKNAILTASRHASAAHDFILACVGLESEESSQAAALACRA